ncbi:hypothetical protein B0G76_2365 [Paraburkholderia sp. BL23I1N1]|nr:hypothetical protein B0G76_2365 [Paraburkholderia sp. BL23I1N1]
MRVAPVAGTLADREQSKRQVWQQWKVWRVR